MPDGLVELVDAFGSPRVLVVGDYMLDRYVWGSVERISQEAPIPVLKVDITQPDHRPGGAGSVVADLAALGAKPAAAGIVGKDHNGTLLRDLIGKHATGVKGLIVDAARPTTVKTRMIARSQQMLRVDEESNTEIADAPAKRLIEHCRRAVKKSDVVVVQDHGKGVVTRELMAALAKACRAAKVPLLVDPARTGDYMKYRGATVLAPNRAEAEHATGVHIMCKDTATEAGRKLIKSLGLKAVLLTLDREGIAVVAKGKQTEMVPANAVEVFDVTGAGDVVAATIALGLAGGHDLAGLARLANVAAGIEVGKIGVGTVTRGEILERIETGSSSRIKSRADLATICADLRSRGREIVFTNGCFDLLHIGHVHLLREAKKFGDVLIVAINSDASVQLVKGPQRPIIPEEARAGMLAALQHVDYVTIYDEDTPTPLLKVIRPDVIVKGGEYGKEGVVGGALVEEMGGRIANVPMVDGYSTTKVAEKAGKTRGKKNMGGRGYVKKK
jgi:D-beta-D-heptose 7-phosphate kinase / D-beta-D-heptose 1-phosphate adenosyltransferase